MSNLCTIPSCYAYGRYCRIPGHMKSDKPAVAPKPIAKTSDSMKDQLKVYKKQRKQFLTQHFKCQVKGCKNASTEVHHMRGRVGYLLNEKKHWMAVCNEHHRKITDNPKFAIENGYSESRLSTTQP